MSMNFIKWTIGLTRKPEVIQIANALSISPAEAAGRLMMVWEWADESTTDGVVYGVKVDTINRCAEMAGFGEAMMNVKPHPWLLCADGNLAFPNWDHHNGKNAKRRANDCIRQRRHRDL